MMHYVNVEVDLDEVLEDVSVEDYFHGCSDKELVDAIRDIADMMKDKSTGSLVCDRLDGIRFTSHGLRDEIDDMRVENQLLTEQNLQLNHMVIGLRRQLDGREP
jgi:predicted DNA-binding ArsR family transcriptional regulator